MANAQYCKHGHKLNSHNVYVTKVGYRQCRACHAARSLERYHATKPPPKPEGYRHTKDAYFPDVIDYVPGWGPVFKEKPRHKGNAVARIPKPPPVPEKPAWRPVFVLLEEDK